MPFVFSQDVEMEVDGWTAWKALHRLCNYHSNLHVAVEMGTTYPLPHEDAMSQAAYVALVRRYLLRWKGEPIGCVMLPTHILDTSGNLPRLVTDLLRQFMDESALIMLDTRWPIESLTPDSEARVELTQHLAQVRRLFDMMTRETLALSIQH
ncbi:MAG: hypothetical protein KVP17_000532 [Porospora cf. gigantea B]|uniref:uncharacterized protein n=1 Tax=Porospora cf. gigantea B TaxID=2853592 RepID=UPI0035719DAF|nr:MAG: hypothetical protein KVP17_000532 [Porospora cf. gigantea B]